MSSYYKWLYGNKCGCDNRDIIGRCTCAEIMSALSALSEAISELDEEFDELDLDDKEKVISEALHYLYHNKAEASAVTELQTAVEELDFDNKEKVVSEALHYLYHNKAEESAVTELQTAVEELDFDNKEKVVSEALHYLYNNKAEESAVTELQTAVEELDDKEKTLAEALHYLYHNKLDTSASTATIDSSLNSGSTNAVTNAAITTALIDIEGELYNKLDVSAYTPTDLTNYDTKSEVNTKISTATSLLNNVLTAHTADTSVHVTTSEKNAWNAKQDPLIAGDNITISGNVISATAGASGVTSGQVQTMIDNSISGKADTSAVTNSLSTKLDTSVYNTYTANTNTALNGKQDTLTAGSGITITSNVISTTTHFLCCSSSEWAQISGSTDSNTIYLVY